ncbi:hypothetical protein HAX54_036649, partial [Datura stramonium]|nr:hypothetical protein [Datura stramonium]
ALGTFVDIFPFHQQNASLDIRPMLSRCQTARAGANLLEQVQIAPPTPVLHLAGGNPRLAGQKAGARQSLLHCS